MSEDNLNILKEICRECNYKEKIFSSKKYNPAAISELEKLGHLKEVVSLRFELHKLTPTGVKTIKNLS